MTSVICFCDDCIWCAENGECNRGAITINEAWECDCFESYRKNYTEPYYQAFYDDDGKPCRRLHHGKKIEYKGYVFYTEDKITDSGNYHVTEARTGIGSGIFNRLEGRWDIFLERVATYPDVSSYPIKESEVAKRREDIENSPADCLTPSVTDSKGERNDL